MKLEDGRCRAFLSRDKLYSFNSQFSANHLGPQMTVAATEFLNTALPSTPEIAQTPDNA
jgi:hypothetical protein